MEEIFVQDFRDNQSDTESNASQWTSGCASPRTTQMLEAVDKLTIDCFSTTVAPLVSFVF